MNEPESEAAPVKSTTSPIPYKDRSAGLIIFGILTILLGCLAGLFIPLMLFGQVAAAQAPGGPHVQSSILPAIFIFAILSIALVWLGIGSIMARRWARALLLIISWGWLIMGLLDSLFMAFLLPKMFANITASATPGHPALPPAAATAFAVVMCLIFGVIFVLLPAIWTFFYNSRHVKATCEARDPVTRWTDACPLPVLGLCLWLMVTVPMMLVTPLMVRGVMPFFGVFLTGLPGMILCLCIAAIWAYAAWSLYHLDRRGWWVILIAMCVMTASSLLTFARHDIIEMYHLMGYPAAQIEQIRKSGLMVGNLMEWMTLFFMVPFLGYLLYIKRYLRK